MTNRERCSERVSSVSVGRCAMSMVLLLQVLRRPPYDAVRGWCWLRRASVRPPEPGASCRVPLSAPSRVPPWLAKGGEDGGPSTVGAGGPSTTWSRARLLGVQLDDQLLLDGRVDDLPGRDAVDQHAQLAADDLQPRRDRTLAGAGLGDLERHHPARLLRHLDDVVRAHPVGGDVDLAAVHPDVPVADQLAGHVAGLGEAGPVDHVVQPRFQDLEQDLTGLAGLVVGLFVVAAELLLQHAVDAAGLLLLAQLQQVLAVLAAAPAVLARRVGPDLDRALGGLALAALEEQLHLLAPAHAAVGSGVTGHVYLPLRLVSDRSDPAALLGAAAVVRLRRHVLDLTHLEAGGLQRADRGLPAGARALHEDVDLPHPVLLGLARSVLGSHLGRERRGLAGALEPDVPGGRPADHVARGVGDRHDRVVEGALDVRRAVSDVLLLLAAHLLGGSCRASPARHLSPV